MKKTLFRLFYISILIFAVACGSKNENPDGTRIVKEFYKNKKLKTEMTVKDTLQHGITKNFDEMGNLVSTVTYVNGYKDGLTVNYYKSGAKNQEMFYVKNQLQGEAKMYYEDGKVYMITNFKDGKKHGVEKTFYKNGKVQSECEFFKGNAGIGLKEYNEKGQLITTIPTIIVKEKSVSGEKLLLEITLSDHSSTVKFFQDTLISGKYSYPFMRTIDTRNGTGKLDWYRSGSAKLRKINIIAVKTTSKRNTLVIQKTYNVGS